MVSDTQPAMTLLKTSEAPMADLRPTSFSSDPLNGSGPDVHKIEAKQVNFYYGSFQALKGITLSAPNNQITALIGPSGCGKSTFLRILNRMNDEIAGARTEGKVLLDGEDIYARDVDVALLRKRVGMVFQKPNPFPMSIFENVVYGPRIHGERNKTKLKDIAEESLRHAALWNEVKDKLNASAFDLSGGQQQRLCIARSLAVGPDVLLMDEPTSALDPNATFKIEELMRDLKKEYTVVIVTHNMQQAARVADQTAFMYLGDLIEAGPTTAMFSNPKDNRTLDYITGRFG